MGEEALGESLLWSIKTQYVQYSRPPVDLTSSKTSRAVTTIITYDVTHIHITSDLAREA